MKKFHLFLVDIQNDFHEGGSLGVDGAKENAKTVIETIIKPYMKQIDGITVSLDIHEVVDIAHKWFWIPDDTMQAKYSTNFPNNPPQPKHPPNFSQLHFFNTDSPVESDNATIKSGEKVFIGSSFGSDLKAQLLKEGYQVPSSSSNADEDKKELEKYNNIKDNEEYKFYWKPADAGLRKYCEKYFVELQRSHDEVSSDGHSRTHEKITTNITSKVSERLFHMIWPDHCLQGSIGQCVYKEYLDVLIEWSEINQKDVRYVLKGSNPLCEMYSAIRAEVPVDGDVSTFPNVSLLKYLLNATKGSDMLGLVLAGQALTHTVRYTMNDILKYWPAAEHEAWKEKERVNAQLNWSSDGGYSTKNNQKESINSSLSDLKEESIDLLDPLDEKYVFNGNLYLLSDGCGYIKSKNKGMTEAITRNTDKWLANVKKIEGVNVIECKDLGPLLNIQ